MATSFPDQLISETEKLDPNGNYGKNHLDFAEQLYASNQARISEMNRLLNSYNGDRANSALFKHFGSVKGFKKKLEPKSYRLARNKISLLIGEYLKRPIKATVYTENIEAVNSKAEQFNFIEGLMLMRQQIENLKNKAGVDIANGMVIPESYEDPVWQKMSFKDKYEKTMQVLLNNGIIEQKMLHKTAKHFLHMIIWGECFKRTTVDANGNEEHAVIDPRNAIYIEMENDDFLERTPIIGAVTRKSISEVLKNNTLNEAQKKALQSAASSESVTLYNNKPIVKYRHGGDWCVDELHIEWKSPTPEYFILSKKSKLRQYIFETGEPYLFLPLSAETYEKNPNKYFQVNPDNPKFEEELANMPKGKTPIVVKYQEDIYEATRYAGCIDVNIRKKPFTLRKEDEPSKALAFSYSGLLFNSIGGERFSLYKELEPFDELFDLIMYKIVDELNSFTGKGLAMDRSIVDKSYKGGIKEVIYDLTVDRFITYNSSDDGAINKAVDVKQLIQQLDFGFSSSFPLLMQAKDNIIATMDRISGINDNREGYSPASQTATGNNAAINASRTATEPLFYTFSLFVEKSLMHLAETYKLTYGLLKKEKGRQILGDNMFSFLELSHKLAYQSYGVSLQDGSKYLELKNILTNKYIPLAINAKQIEILDAFKSEKSETFVETLNIFETALKRSQEQEQLIAERKAAYQQELMDKQLQGEIEKDTASRREKIAGDLEKTREKGRVQVAVKDNDTKNQMHVDYNKAQLDKEKNTPQHY